MKSNMAFHDPEHEFEKHFWGKCTNTYGEETKQWVYAHYMMMPVVNWQIDVRGVSILDIGGGPVSMLLKCVNLGPAVVVDPIRYPDWVYDRYRAHRVMFAHMNGEDINMGGFDEVWIYNVLQHCMDPEKIVANAKCAAPRVRIFEWLDIDPHPGHPQILRSDELDKWFGAKGHVEDLDTNGCYGKSYSGVFLND